MRFKELLIKAIAKRKYSYKQLRALTYDICDKCDMPYDEGMTLLNELIEDGELFEISKGKFCSSSALGLKKGVYMGSTKDYGFCHVDGEDEDIFLPPQATAGAMNKDIVLVKVVKEAIGRNREGKVVKILARGSSEIVGTYHAHKGYGIIYPDEKRFGKKVFIMRGDSMNARDGDKVVTKVTTYGRKDLKGRVSEVIGDENKKGNDILSIIRQYHLYEEFPEKVLQYARTIPDKVSDKDKKGRRDFTGLKVFTIDGEDARDFDDAVSIVRNDDKTYTLGVHIADVSHYVTQGNPLDDEAYNRSTSVYFPDRVLPMLPVELSNGICSLNPDVDRLTLSVLMKMDKDANVLSHEIVEGVIHSCHRLTYHQVQRVLDGDPQESDQLRDIKDDLILMADIAAKLENKRIARGALDFEIPETFVELDENGKTIGISARERLQAHRLIESFMIICNEVVAREMCDKGVPFVYRVHEKPAIDRMTNFVAFVESLGVNADINVAQIKPKDLQELISNVKDLDSSKVINTAMLRSLKKARYYQDCLGHFGLASEYYCHFTSPIRRYPDLIIHRIIKMIMHGKLNKSIDFMRNYVARSSMQSSDREKLADEAERAVDDLKKAEYMSDHIGEEYIGIVSGVCDKGLFVELDNTCEGFVSIDNLPQDDYMCDDKLYELNGRHNKFKLGNKLKVAVESVNLHERKINFIYKKLINQ